MTMTIQTVKTMNKWEKQNYPQKWVIIFFKDVGVLRFFSNKWAENYRANGLDGQGIWIFSNRKQAGAKFRPLMTTIFDLMNTAVGWRGRQLCEDSMKLYFFKHVFSWLAPEGSMCCISPLSHQNLPAKDRIKPRCVTLVEKLRGFRFCDALLPGCYQFNCLCPHRSAAVNYAGVCFKTLYLES